MYLSVTNKGLTTPLMKHSLSASFQLQNIFTVSAVVYTAKTLCNRGCDRTCLTRHLFNLSELKQMSTPLAHSNTSYARAFLHTGKTIFQEPLLMVQLARQNMYLTHLWVNHANTPCGIPTSNKALMGQ